MPAAIADGAPIAQRIDAREPAFQPQTIQAARALIIRLGNQSNLILDPDLDSYYTMSLTLLRFPELLEQLMKYHMLARSGDQTQYLIAQGRLAALRDGIESDYKAAYNGNPSRTLSAQLDVTRARLLEALPPDDSLLVWNMVSQESV